MQIAVDDRWRVRASCDVALPLPASAVWGQMRDVRRFCSIDPLHVRVQMTPAQSGAAGWPPVGARLVLAHRLFGFGPDRVGRILYWREGRGFAFSDLSRRGPRAGFPHVCEYHLRAEGAERCCLTIAARGRWTMRALPRWIVRLWLRWVLAATARQVRSEMSAYRAWLTRRGRAASGAGSQSVVHPEAASDLLAQIGARLEADGL